MDAYVRWEREHKRCHTISRYSGVAMRRKVTFTLYGKHSRTEKLLKTNHDYTLKAILHTTDSCNTELDHFRRGNRVKAVEIELGTHILIVTHEISY